MKGKIYRVIGLAGVDHRENKRAKRVGRLFEWPMVILAIYVLFVWQMLLTGIKEPEWMEFGDILVWAFFVLESLALTFLVDNKKRYLVTNYMNIVIILIGLPVLWGDFSYAATLRAGRLLVLLVLLISLFDTLLSALSKYKLSLTFGVAGFVVIISGILIAGFDPGIKSPGEGIWWAWVTVTTVGYGDVVPTSTPGKIIAMILIGIGIGLFSVLTASFSALFISRQEEKVLRKERDMQKSIDEISKKLDKIEKKLNKLDD